MPKTRRVEFPDFKALGKGMEDLLHHLPEIAGISATNFFQDRFEQKGWIDKSGLESWEDRKNSSANGSTLHVTGFLKGAFDYTTGNNWVNVRNYAAYSSIHNEGGIINHPGGTYYIVIGPGKAVFINKTTAQSLKAKGRKVKKTKPHLIKIPQRQYMGHSDFYMQRLEKGYIDQTIKLTNKHL